MSLSPSMYALVYSLTRLSSSTALAQLFHSKLESKMHRTRSVLFSALSPRDQVAGSSRPRARRWLVQIEASLRTVCPLIYFMKWTNQRGGDAWVHTWVVSDAGSRSPSPVCQLAFVPVSPYPAIGETGEGVRTQRESPWSPHLYSF